ncbi:MAG: FKBP-type peptidyl-prolyl cis-trans isomerase [Clostridia bacterium]|nr:FKBP-type peptidyl-prolyl cis-trans isomerase [Clostridia bacterium]
MKRILSVLLALLMFAALSGCKEKQSNVDGIEQDKNRLNYNYDMSKYVQLDTYKTELDSSGEMYKYFFDGKLREMMVAKFTTGKLSSGDVANIDYVGKKDGVAFRGGTANGYDLTIGSGSFIAGFEDGLIGAEIGSTVDLNLTFPSDYQEPSLAGQAVVFTVRVNYVKKQLETVNNENAKLCGYASAAEVMDAAKKYATENAAWETVSKNAKIETHPEKETTLFYNEQINSYKRAAKQNGMTLEQYLAYYEMTEAELEKELKETYVPQMSNGYALGYYIIDAAGEAITSEKIAQIKKELDSMAGGDVYSLGITENFVEAEAAKALAVEIVAKNATVK